MSLFHIGKTLNTVDQNIVKTIKEGTDFLSNPNEWTQENMDKLWEDIHNVFKDSSQQIGNEALREAKEAVTKNLLAGGMSKEDAEAWSSNYLKKVVDSAEKVRKNMPKIKATGRLAWLKLTGAVSLLSVATMGFFAAHSGPTAEEQEQLDLLNRTQAENEEVQRLTVSEAEFNNMVSGLTAPSAPPVTEEAPAPAAAAAAPEVLPPPIAAIAAAPAAVEVTTLSGTQQINSTVGTVYRYSPPPVRRVMVQPFHIDHDYDHPSDNTDWHFLEHKSPPHHMDYTVDSGFASIHVSY